MPNCEDRPQRRGSRQKWKRLRKRLNARITKQEAMCEPGCSASSRGVVLIECYLKLHAAEKPDLVRSTLKSWALV